VKFTAIDAFDSGFKTSVFSDATRAVNLQPKDGENALEEMRQKGIHILNAKNIIR
jgi:nicotinamidase/pyrazinamidase